MKKKFECTCEKCKGACENKPGWFMPGEAEKVSQYLNLSLKDLFDNYLGVDWWKSDNDIDNDIFILAPIVVGAQAGSEYPSNPRGRCIFFNNGLCDIHSVKPFECAALICDEPRLQLENRHKDIANSWRNNQKQIIELLDRKPEVKEFYGGGLFSAFNF